MIKVLVLLIISFLPSLSLANEQRCQSDRYHKMMDALSLSEDSFSNVKYGHECDEEYFCVMATLGKPLKFKKFDLRKGFELRICNSDNGWSDVNYVNLPKEIQSFEVRDNLYCRDEFSLDIKGNFCSCILAKDYKYFGNRLPKDTSISMDESGKIRWFNVRKKFDIKGKSMKPGFYSINSDTGEIHKMRRGESDVYGECGRD